MEISIGFKEYLMITNSKIELKPVASSALSAVTLKTLWTDYVFQNSTLHHSASTHRGTH